jgi:putative endonuclease
VNVIDMFHDFMARLLPASPNQMGKLRREQLRMQDNESMRLGQWGEDQAAEFLHRKRNYHIVARNWFYGKYELDLVAYHGQVLVFVEVKTRRTGSPGTGYYSVGRRKKRALWKACRAYLVRLREVPRRYQFDIVEVIAASEQEEPKIIHFQDIKLAPNQHNINH